PMWTITAFAILVHFLVIFYSSFIIFSFIQGSVTLPTGLTGLNGDDILWIYGSDQTLLLCDGGEITRVPEEYAGRLQLDQSSGCLTISNIRKSAVFRGEMLKGNKTHNFDYNVTVLTRNPLLANKHPNTETSLGFEICSARCWVENSFNVILSWYRGSEIIMNTSDPDVSNNLTLTLEIQRKNESIYTCRAENPVSNKTAALNSRLWCSAHDITVHSALTH
uniref:Ig-like domain-containing protein n=1 Tax=Oreochromis aureus TaxID=47969 RepID=A0A668RVK4_OREAU